MNYFESNGVLDTKYRDVPFDAVAGCFTPSDEEDRQRWEQECRGQSIVLFTPPLPDGFVDEGFDYKNSGQRLRVGPAPPCPSGCRGPFFTIAGYEGTVCSHLVEVGN
jgi:hypothetical protein